MTAKPLKSRRSICGCGREPLGRPEEVANFLNVPVQTLYWWRHRGRGEGPPSIKVGRGVRYRWDDVDAWLTAQQSAA